MLIFDEHYLASESCIYLILIDINYCRLTTNSMPNTFILPLTGAALSRSLSRGSVIELKQDRARFLVCNYICITL